MGIELDNPIIVGASNLSKDLDKHKEAKELGAGAIKERNMQICLLIRRRYL